MTRLKRQPPSRERYASRHPSIGVHIDLDTRERLLALRERTGLSFGRLVQQALGVVETDLDRVLELGRQRGFAAGRSEGWTEGSEAGFIDGRKAGYAEAAAAYRISITCPQCGNALHIPADSEAAAAAESFLANGGWAHSECNGQRPREAHTVVQHVT